MNNRQTAKKNMYNRVLTFLGVPANAAVWAAFTRLVTEITNFEDLVGEIEEFLQKQQQQSKGVTTDKNKKYVDMVAITLKFARKARVWAEDNGNNTLEAIFDIQESDFGRLAEDVGESRIADVRKALNDNIASLGAYNVMPANITDIDAAIAAYHADAGKPGAAIAGKKLGTDALVAIFEEADKSLAKIDDLLIHEYEYTNPTVVREYKNNRVIVTVGVHHQGIDAHVTYSDGSGDAEGVTMTILELNKSGDSDIDGMVEVIRGKVGTYHVRFEGAGIVTKEVVAKITGSQILHLGVAVVKV